MIGGETNNSRRERVRASHNTVISEVMAERARQDALWGKQDHTPHQWLAILAEETGEVAKEVADCRVEAFRHPDYRKELIHVAAVAVAAIESHDRER